MGVKYIPVKNIKVVRERTVKTEVKRITSSGQAVKLVKEFYDDLAETREAFTVWCLDTKNTITAIQLVSIGILDQALVHPREVFRIAVLEQASAIIVAHNHPSGDPEPSEADIDVTHRLQDAGTLLGIDVYDHIIVGDKAISLQEEGKMK